MSPETTDLVRRLFDAALDRPEGERIPFLEAACAGRAEVLARVKELLSARTAAGDFLERESDKPKHIGRYVVTGEIGRGAMGIVYEAVDPLIERKVAIKVIHLQPLAGSADTLFLRDRLFREARSAGMLFHPNIAVILDVGQDGDLSFIAMERVEGPSLYQVVEKNGKLDRASVVSIVRETAAALDFAHAKGVVHRDIKPANIMLDKGTTVKVADFGIAKITSAQHQTQTGFPMGTPSYMSPEQVDGKTLDGASDQFSLAVVAYELLTGVKPFQADTITALMHSIAYAPRPSAKAANPELPGAVDEVFKRGLARTSTERYASCSEFVAALEKALAAEVTRPLPAPAKGTGKGRYIIAAVVALVVLAGAGLGYRFWAASRNQTASAPPATVAGPVSQRSSQPPSQAQPANGQPAAPVITRFAADRSPIAPGDAATLNWDTSGAGSLKIEPDVGQVPPHGPLAVRPAKTTTYILTTENASGKNSAETTVVVTAPAAGAGKASGPSDALARAHQLYLNGQAKSRAGQSAQALPLLRQAGDLGETKAMLELGDYYQEDVDGSPRDAAESLRWYRKAADAGDTSAMIQVGAFYDLGIGVPQDDQQAGSWYRKAAEHGSSAGMFDLGKMYESGRGVPKDLDKARDLYRRAAAAGNAEANSRLAALHGR